MGVNRYGNITQDELQTALDTNVGDGETEVSTIRKKIVIEFTNSERTYYIDNSGNVQEYTYHDLAVMEGVSTFRNTISDYIELIVNIKVVDYLEIPESAAKSFDVSQNQDKSVMAWLIVNEDDSNYYDLYIGGDDGVLAPKECQSLFSSFTECVNIDLEHFYTENTTNMRTMFYHCTKLEVINVSNLNTSNVSDMRNMFEGCNSLTNLDVTNFDTSNVIYMDYMFAYCSSLTELNLSTFDTSNVVYMSHMFRNCTNLETLDLSSFDTSNITSFAFLFNYCTSLMELNISNFNAENVTDINNTFNSVPTDVQIITNSNMKEWLNINFSNYTNITVID